MSVQQLSFLVWNSERDDDDVEEELSCRNKPIYSTYVCMPACVQSMNLTYVNTMIEAIFSRSLIFLKCSPKNVQNFGKSKTFTTFFHMNIITLS